MSRRVSERERDSGTQVKVDRMTGKKGRMIFSGGLFQMTNAHERQTERKQSVVVVATPFWSSSLLSLSFSSALSLSSHSVVHVQI